MPSGDGELIVTVNFEMRVFDDAEDITEWVCYRRYNYAAADILRV